MFENLDFKNSLDEDRFENWLVEGRASKIRFNYLVILWDEIEKDYRAVYLMERSELASYNVDARHVGDVFVAAYDLYSESKIM